MGKLPLTCFFSKFTNCLELGVRSPQGRLRWSPRSKRRTWIEDKGEFGQECADTAKGGLEKQDQVLPRKRDDISDAAVRLRTARLETLQEQAEPFINPLKQGSLFFFVFCLIWWRMKRRRR